MPHFFLDMTFIDGAEIDFDWLWR